MAPRLPLEVLEQIIDDVAADPEYDDSLYISSGSIKACALVCHSFLPLCRKYIFAYVVLNEPGGCFKFSSPTSDDLDHLLSDSPHLAVYIRKLDYQVRVVEREFDPKRSPWLSFMFKKLVKLQKLSITYFPTAGREKLNWMALSERMVLLPLLHLPTLTSIGLERIGNFPLADLAGCVNLKKLEVHSLECSNDAGKFLEVLPPTPAMLEQLEIYLRSNKIVQRLCDARRPDGKPIIDFTSLRKIKAEVVRLDSIMELFGMCRNLYKINLISMSLPHYFFIHLILLLVSPAVYPHRSESTSSLKGLFTMLKPSLPTLVDIDIECDIYNDDNETDDTLLAGLCHELEKMAGQNVVETIKLLILVYPGCDCTRWGELDDVLMGSPEGWPALRKVSLFFGDVGGGLNKALRELPMPKLVESKQVQFDFGITEDIMHKIY